MPYVGINEMGANRKGNPCRANGAGDVVLYCADLEKTAIAEVRPVRGFLVTVAQLGVRENICVLDLVAVAEDINPFLVEGEMIPYWLALEEFFARIAWLLARPLEKGDDPNDYLPSQLFAEYVKQTGFDGIRYPSAMASGTSNIVLLNPDACDFVSSALVKVVEVDIQYTRDVKRFSLDYPE